MSEQVPRTEAAAGFLGLHFLRVDDPANGEGKDRQEALGAGGLREAYDHGAGIRGFDALGLQLRDVGEEESRRFVELDGALNRVHDIVRGDRVATRELLAVLEL